MKILCDAIPFGFGPVAKLIAIGRCLNKHCETVFVGSGCSLALASTSNCFNQIKKINTLAPEESESLSKCINGCVGAISVMNPAFTEWVVSRGIPTVIVDSLFSMWDYIPPAWYLANAVVLQRFDEVENRAEREFSRNNVQIVGPILDPIVRELPPRGYSYGTLLVNLGGAEDPIAENTFLCARTMLKLLSGLPNLDTFQRKILTVGPMQRHELLPLKREGFEIVTLAHDSFLKELAGASLFCTTPGLTATFESFALQVPCVFLPPFNYSQFLNLLTFRRNAAAPFGIHWKDYGIGNDVYKGMNEVLAVKRLESIIEYAMQDMQLVGRLRQGLSDLIAKAATPDLAASLVATQNAYFKSLGGIGTEDAVNYILEIFHG